MPKKTMNRKTNRKTTTVGGVKTFTESTVKVERADGKKKTTRKSLKRTTRP